MTIGEIIQELNALKRFDPVEKMWRVYVSDIKIVAKRLGRNHPLALDLWRAGDNEAKHLAIAITTHKQFDNKTLDSWVADLDGWYICDDFCSHITCFLENALSKVKEWAVQDDLYVRRAAFATLSYLSLKKCRKSDAELLPFLSLIEHHAYDDRDHVRKAVNWALRSLGKRNSIMKNHAIVMSNQLQTSPNKNVRWVGSHRMKEVINATFTS